MNLREYTCPNCGYSAWALDHILECNCFKCKTPVRTEPVPIVEITEKSFVTNKKKQKKVI